MAVAVAHQLGAQRAGRPRRWVGRLLLEVAQVLGRLPGEGLGHHPGRGVADTLEVGEPARRHGAEPVGVDLSDHAGGATERPHLVGGRRRRLEEVGDPAQCRDRVHPGEPTATVAAGWPSRRRLRFRATIDSVSSTAVHLEVDGHDVAISNPDKLFFSAAGATKLDLARYYVAVGAGALRGVRERPTVLKRYPDGAEETSSSRSGCPPDVPTGCRR